MADASRELERLERLTQAFFASVGQAIAKWAYVDRALFELCRYALGTNDVKTAAVFYRSPNIKEHLELTESLIALSVRERHYIKWKPIYDSASKLLPFRNDIAHNPTKYTILVGAEGNDAERHQLWTLETEPRKLLKTKNKPTVIAQEDLTKHVEDVNELLRRLREFTPGLPKRPLKTPPKPSEPTSRRTRGSESKPRKAPPRIRTRRRPQPRS